MNANYFKKKLNLVSHPEGGYFSEVYRDSKIISSQYLPDIYNGDRNISTLIYFLLEKNDISKFHILNSDEIWHFYAGSSVRLYLINTSGKYKGKLIQKVLGNRLDNQESFNVIIRANTYFSAEVIDKNSFALVGCTVAPGFDFQDFYMPSREELIKLYPQHTDIIEKFT